MRSTSRPEWVADSRQLPGQAAPDLVDAILSRAEEPWVGFELGTAEIARVRGGGIAVVMGPSGSGKSSLVAGLIEQHARDRGPAIYLSCELPADELAARICGMQVGASWEDVLRGRVRREDMERALALPRLVVLERREATLRSLGQRLGAARSEEPEAPILVAVDYVQILPAAGDREIRARVTESMEQIDSLARDHRAVVLAISQMSRSNARAARSGEALGLDTADGGAESAAIERYASLTLTIGAAQPPEADGSQRAQVSVGKYRMGGGDRVVPMRYEGRTGLWRVDGEARLASEVRAEVTAKRDDARAATARLAIIGAAERAKEPLSREELAKAAGVRGQFGRAVVNQLIESGDLVEVQRRRPRSPRTAWLVWTASKAATAGLPLLGKVHADTAKEKAC
jgi:hypothetical protein